MINRLKRKFLIIGTVFMFLLMTVLVLVMNLVNYREVVSESDSVLDALSRFSMPYYFTQNPWDPDDVSGFVPPGMSIEVMYESRFFDVTISGGGEILGYDLSRIISVDGDSVSNYIQAALDRSASRGFIGSFRYYKVSDENYTRIFFLDCGRKLDQFKDFLWISVFVGLGGCVLVFFAFLFAAGRIVAPISESYEKQKRFISDAGHEIKTPLTIINANVDLLELDGEQEELTEIRQQTKRLTELTNDLIMLSKMEEAEHTLQKIDFPLSDLVSETAGSFRAPAAAKGVELGASITPDVTANGSPDSVRQLVSILLENAVKYSVDNGSIAASLTTHKKYAVLTVENHTAEAVNEDDLKHVFDRFYRTDSSRNSATGGHGIGLSIAKAIVDAHSGSITAEAEDGNIFKVTVSLPLQGK